jgi:phospholipase/carboxylesterase
VSPSLRAGLLLALAMAACESPAPPARLAAQAPAPARALQARWIGDARRDGPLVVLLHGYGAPGDDLVPLGEELARATGVRVALPVAPLPGPGGGRAWWAIDLRGVRPSDRGAERPVGLAEARRDLLAWLDAQRREGRLRAARTLLAGFSQGAMLAADAALEWEAPVAGVAMLSGNPIDEVRWTRRLRERPPPPFFISHGRGDPLLDVRAAERWSARVEQASGRVTFVPFDGSHTIPPAVRQALAAFVGATFSVP